MKKKLKDKIFVSLDNVRCPICNGVINEKWFNFRNKNIVEFVAECWSGKINKDTPKHIFYFQIEIPECVLVCDKNSKVFDDE